MGDSGSITRAQSRVSVPPRGTVAFLWTGIVGSVVPALYPSSHPILWSFGSYAQL